MSEPIQGYSEQVAAEKANLNNAFIEHVRSAYRSLYSQQKHLDPEGGHVAYGHGQDALASLRAAFQSIGIQP